MQSIFAIIRAMGNESTKAIYTHVLGNLADATGFCPLEELERLIKENPDELLARTVCEFETEEIFVEHFAAEFKLARLGGELSQYA